MDGSWGRPVFAKRKMVLWYTKTFKPIITHNDLEPIMANLGFLGLPPSAPKFPGGYAWKEYVYTAGVIRPPCKEDLSAPPPRPRIRLPHPRIDGLHFGSFEAFLEAVNFYVKIDDMSLLFHVRALPIKRADLCYEWLEDRVYYYRDGTIDNVPSTPNLDKEEDDNEDGLDRYLIRSKSRRSKPFQMVPFSDIIVRTQAD
ncbi:hypothetical protein MLD38_013309 [Melastoma candidum]|uniref:Uncharacterized protein n=1 Tax=Melastoma candidum TaxID=119954 RepID=A0ACB9RAB3_9MYRT|nr:hypothetical protein MLD38_013309 [Melastoma candidum]